MSTNKKEGLLLMERTPQLAKMELLAVVVAACLAVLAWRFKLSSKKKNQKKLPPGPTPLPFVGNLFQIGKLPHLKFAQMSTIYGPLMSIRLGGLLNVVVSSPELAKEVLTKQGFAGRYTPQALKAHDHHKFSLGTLPVTSRKWKDMRKLCKDQMFTNPSLEASQALRKEKLLQLLDYVGRCCDGGREVNIRDAVFTTTLNLMSATLFSAEDMEFDSDLTRELKEIMEDFTNVVGVPNLADFFPVLERLDPQSVRRRADKVFGRMLRLAKSHIDQRVESKRNPNSPKKNDFLETLVDISLGNEFHLGFDDIQHLLKDLYVSGAGSPVATIEWVMAELLLHPEKLSKAKSEVRAVIGEKKLIDESDISKLPFLQAVMKEAFRLHPPGPLLIPRTAEKDMEIGGYFIPEGTRTLFNVWAMGRDPSIWSNPEAFEPQRFLEKNIDYKGLHYELIPFGAGRRVCPGIPLAHRIMHATVAALIGNFDWEFAAGEKDRNDECFGGLALQREAPLIAVPIKP